MNQQALDSHADLLLRETNHRCGNDLQLVVSLLLLQSIRAANDETRQALADAAERVAVLARGRHALNQELSLESMLSQVCSALNIQAEPRSILIVMQVEQQAHGLASEQITTLALVVNELTTNAIKHAFKEGKAGQITIIIGRHDNGDVTVAIDDDGLPLPEGLRVGGNGLGLGLAKRLMDSIDGSFIPPTGKSKRFELRVPHPSATRNLEETNMRDLGDGELQDMIDNLDLIIRFAEQVDDHVLAAKCEDVRTVLLARPESSGS